MVIEFIIITIVGVVTAILLLVIVMTGTALAYRSHIQRARLPRSNVATVSTLTGLRTKSRLKIAAKSSDASYLHRDTFRSESHSLLWWKKSRCSYLIISVVAWVTTLAICWSVVVHCTDLRFSVSSIHTNGSEKPHDNARAAHGACNSSVAGNAITDTAILNNNNNENNNNHHHQQQHNLYRASSVSIARNLAMTAFSSTDPSDRVAASDIALEIYALHWRAYFESDEGATLPLWNLWRVAFEIRRAAAVLYIATFSRACAQLYFHAPEVAGWGGWGGAAPSDICATVSRPVSSKHWDAHPDECARTLYSKFVSVEILVRYAVIASVLWMSWRAISYNVALAWTALLDIFTRTVMPRRVRYSM